MISLIQYTVSYDTRFGWSGPLKSLSLYNNNIGDAGAAAIANAIAVNASVTKLDLRLNQIGDAGATAIANAIAVNASVTDLRCARFLTKPS